MITYEKKKICQTNLQQTKINEVRPNVISTNTIIFLIDSPKKHHRQEGQLTKV